MEGGIFVSGAITVLSKERLKKILVDLGIQKGMLLLVEIDYKKIGYVIGGIQTVVEALMDVVGYEGTIVVPTFTMQLLDPSCKEIAFEREDWEEIRANTRTFDRHLSVPESGCEFANQFLRNDGVARSCHPLFSFAAWGKYAKLLCDRHPLHFGLSHDSPLGKLHDLDGYVLQIGSGYADTNAFYLSKYYDNVTPIQVLSVPVEHNHELRWKALLEIELGKEEFEAIGHKMEEKGVIKKAPVHQTEAIFYSMKDASLTGNAYFLNMGK